MAEKDNEYEIPHRKYRLELIEKWTQEYQQYLVRKNKWKGKTTKYDSQKIRVKNTKITLGRLPKVHRQVKYDPRDGKKRRQRRCRYCTLYGLTSWSTFVCDTCFPCTGLCRPRTGRNCFVLYHERFFPEHAVFAS